MADSYRLNVLKKLTDHLKGIGPANGNYDYDLSEAVFRGRTVFGENDPIPLISILESPRSDSGLFADGGNERAEQWNLLIQGWAVDDVDNPTDPAYGLMDAVEQRLFRLTKSNQFTGNPEYPSEYLLGKSIAGLRVLPGVVRPPMDNVSSKAFFYLPVRLTLVRTDG